MPDPDRRLRLFVAGDSVNSRQAVRNLRAFCAGDDFEIVDVLDNGQVALDEQIWVTPTLLVDDGAETQRIIGTLSEPEVLERVLGRPPSDETEGR